MKEFTIEEKAQKYDKAFRIAQELYNNPYSSNVGKGYVYTVFPELKESDDERIMKNCIHFLELQKQHHAATFEIEECIAWLEKQKDMEVKLIISDEGYSKAFQDGIEEALTNPHKYGLEKQGEKTSDKIVEKARKEKQRVLLTETDGSANIDWDCRSLDDVKILLKCALEFIHTVEANKQILTDTRFGGCSIRVPTRYDKEIKQGEQKSADNEPKFKVGDIITPKDRGHEPWQIMQVDILDKKYRFKDGYVIHFSQEDNYEFAEQKPTDKVELKFKVCDIITNGEIIGKIDENKNNKYHGWFGYDKNMCVHYSDISDIEDWHLWTIQDAKDGDVLVDEDNNIGIYKKIEGICWHSYIYLGYDNRLYGFNIGGAHIQNNTKPATKEQRDLLFQKMKEAGYEWDAEKKELKKIKDEEYNGEDYGIDSLYHAQRILEKTLGKVDGYQSDDGILEHKCAITAVKKLYSQKPAWSEEDESMCVRTIGALSSCLLSEVPEEVTEEINWLKSLRPQNTWKPSDKQMNALQTAIGIVGELTSTASLLKEIKEQLKKLKG